MCEHSREYDLYNDIQKRCGGEIYLGVVGPVRTGKSTFIKHFMQECVLPNMIDEEAMKLTNDELPQSASGKTIMTTEPKFIPMQAAVIEMGDAVKMKVRLIDCVGYMVPGALGIMEEGTERLVKTPWSSEEIPFSQAAEIGTDKVIRDHSTVGIVITCDGSFGDLPREAYLEAEEKTVETLKAIHKPFLMILNTDRPFAKETQELAERLHEKYQVTVLPENCENMHKGDFLYVLQNILYEFPLTKLEFYMPKWLEMLEQTHPLKQELIEAIKNAVGDWSTIRDVTENKIELVGEHIKRCNMEPVNLSEGSIRFSLDIDDKCYYEMLSNLMHENISNEYQLLKQLKDYAEKKREYEQVEQAMQSVRMKGYGVVTPDLTDIVLEKPELIRHGNKYGIKMRAYSPSIHLIRANIETEISPIVGTEQQAKDLIDYINASENEENGIWNTNIFGKTMEELVHDGIHGKISLIGDECQTKLQDTMQKIVNDTTGGMVCIIL